MARTGVTVELQDTAIGTSSSNEGVAMLVLPVSSASPLIDTPRPGCFFGRSAGTVGLFHVGRWSQIPGFGVLLEGRERV